MLLQRLNKNDLPEIIAFNRRCFSPGDRWSGEDWTELLEDERAHYYALLENGQIVGNMFLYDWQGERDFLKIMNLGVAPDRRGQGLACRLLEKAADDPIAYGDQFKEILDEQTALKELRASILAENKEHAEADRRIRDAAGMLENAVPHIAEWDETAVRQLVAQVKVLSKSEISVTLKSGIEIRQSISN